MMRAWLNNKTSEKVIKMLSGTTVIEDAEPLKVSTTAELSRALRDVGYLVTPQDTILGSLGAIIVDLTKRIKALENERI